MTMMFRRFHRTLNRDAWLDIALYATIYAVCELAGGSWMWTLYIAWGIVRIYHAKEGI